MKKLFVIIVLGLFNCNIVFADMGLNCFITSINVRDSKTQEIEYKEYMTSYTLKNVPAIKEEKYVNNIENYVSSLHHELSSVQMPKQAIQNYSVLILH